MLRKLNFTTRIFLASAALVVIALGTAGIATYLRGEQIAKAAAVDSLEHSREIQQSFETVRLQRLKLMTDLVSNDTAFVSYVLETATSNDPFSTGSSNKGSIKDLLTERQEEVGFDLGVVLDSSGQPVAQVGGVAQVQGGLSVDPVVAAVMKSQRVATGYWARDNHVYQVAAAPLANRDQLAGYLVLALDIDQAELQHMARVSGSELTILDMSGGKYTSVAGTLTPAAMAALAPILGNRQQTSGQFPLTLDSERWLAHADALQPGIMALTLTSLDRAMAGYRAILTTLIVAAVIATLLALVLSSLLSRRLVEPLRGLAQAAQAAARGDYRHKLPAPTAGGEIAQVTQAVDSLLSDLREKEEMEKYLGDLAKFQQDDNTIGLVVADDATPGAAMTERVFLALAAPASIQVEAADVDTLLQDMEAPVRRQGGRLAATTDRSAILVFGSLHAAFIAGGDVLHRAQDQKQPLSAALASSPRQVSRTEWSAGQQGAAMGIPVRSLEDLLKHAPAGALVASADLGTKAKVLLDAVVRPLPEVNGAKGITVLELPTRSQTVTPSAGTPTGHTQGVISRAPTLRLDLGAVLGGRYEILSELGSGGMGVVYKVRDRQLDQIIALKTIRSDGLRDSEMLETLKSEIRLSRQITHRNVVRIYDLGEIAGLPFISMEYVRGMTLKYLLQKRGRVPVSAGLRVMRQVCTALQVAHEQGILHRDVKPDNVMLEPTGNAKLMDFGIASQIKITDGNAKDAVIVGTPAYAPPEQLKGNRVDERADLYACGVLMYRMFTGMLPFDDRHLDKMIDKKTKADYRAAITVIQDLPASLDSVINSCLKVDRNDRPRSAGVLLAALEGIRS